MPAGETTSTKDSAAPEPVGWVAAILTGSGESGRSRVCEIVWLDAELFGGADPLELVAVTEESYTHLSDKLGQEVAPGLLGENLVLREMNFALLSLGDKFSIGDAKVQVVSVDENTVRFLLLEEGLVEPGSPVARVAG